MATLPSAGFAQQGARDLDQFQWCHSDSRLDEFLPQFPLSLSFPSKWEWEPPNST